MFSFWSLQILLQDGIATTQQHSVLDLVRDSGLVVQGILYLLVLFSVVSWGIIAQKYRQVHRAKRESIKFIETFWERRNLSSIHDASRELAASPVGQVFRSGYEELVRVSRSKKESSPGASNERRDYQVGKKLFISRHRCKLGTVRWLVRHGLGHHRRVPRAQCHPFVEHSSGRSRHCRGSGRDRRRVGSSNPGLDGV